MWTALVVIAVVLFLIWLLAKTKKKQGKLEEKNRVDDLILKDIKESKRIDHNIDNMSIAAKRILLKQQREKFLSNNDTN